MNGRILLRKLVLLENLSLLKSNVQSFVVSASVQCTHGQEGGVQHLKCSAVQFVFISFAAEQVSPNRRGGQRGVKRRRALIEGAILL